MIPNDDVRLEYAHLLRDYRKTSSKNFITNRFPWHCRENLKELVQYAFEKQKSLSKGEEAVEMMIFSGSFPDYNYEYDPVKSGLSDFLSIGGNLRLLVHNHQLNDKPGIFEHFRTFPEQIRAKGIGKVSKVLGNHFLVVGDAYRNEAYHDETCAKHFDAYNPEIPATVCFNDVAGAAILKNRFQILWKYAEQLSI